MGEGHVRIYLEGFAHSAAAEGMDAEGMDADRDNGSASVRVRV
jgi:hypothetical protein